MLMSLGLLIRLFQGLQAQTILCVVAFKAGFYLPIIRLALELLCALAHTGLFKILEVLYFIQQTMEFFLNHTVALASV